MTIKLEVNGEQYSQFDTASVTKRLDALSSAFGFQVTSEDGKPLPFKGGESCRVFVDGDLFLTGSIEVVSINYSSRTHDITVEGRDLTGDILDSTLDSISSLSGQGLTLKALIERVVSELGLELTVIDQVNPEPFNAAEDIGSPEPGDNAFDFIEKFTRKRQVLLTSNAEGNIVITQSSGTTVNANIQHVLNNDTNNVLTGSVSYDTTGRFNVYKMASSLNPGALNIAGSTPVDQVVDQKSDPVTDVAIRTGRQLVLIAETSNSNGQNTSRAEWEKSIRKAKGRVYSVTVDGFRNQNGDLWTINTLVNINDDFAGIRGRMLVNSVGFSFDLDNGSQTTLSFVEPDAYTLALNEPVIEEDAGDAFSFG